MRPSVAMVMKHDIAVNREILVTEEYKNIMKPGRYEKGEDQVMDQP